MKATTIQQSRELAKYISVETADMCYTNFSVRGTNYVDPFELNTKRPKVVEEIVSSAFTDWYKYWEIVPCWSLGALIDLLPSDIEKRYFLEISKTGDNATPYEVRYYRFRKEQDQAEFGRITYIAFHGTELLTPVMKMIIEIKKRRWL